MLDAPTLSLSDLAYWPYFTVLIAAQIFAILNPLSVIPVFLSMTDDLDRSTRRRILFRSSVAVFMICLIMALAGNYILSFFNINIASLRVGGGILLMVIAIEMLGGLPRTKVIDQKEEVAIVPIATPLLVGPGTMTTVILLSATTPLGVLVASIMIVAVLTYLILRYSEHLARLIGKNGIRALGRFMTIIISAFAAQLIYSGITDWLVSWGLIS
ncbi:MAG: MarC family protein [Candidatus Verstraetearchaeota archaeon]|nr:MarC family protein [Candidatus Verstraetearchaeota archaeon]